MTTEATPGALGSNDQSGPLVPKRCEPENCGGLWDKCHDSTQTLFKVDTTDCEVRCVTGGAWPAKDSEGETCFLNTHFSTHRAALEKLRSECDAWLSLNFRERGRLHERLAELEKEDQRARDGLRRALAGLGLRA
jgi:hypothetical protein